ncbi:YybH family protein [Bradyrhizobium sp. HKCCYLS1011]|uniref:YybH family protein n=1 Tax=Bradyrhizobium sp. HKCCYLS1011 TaxID=3420733 RepID=UPI003EBF2E74
MVLTRITAIVFTCGLTFGSLAYAADEFVNPPASGQPSKLAPIPRLEQLSTQLPSATQRNRFSEFAVSLTRPNAALNSDYVAIRSVVDGVIDALSKRDVAKMSEYYSNDPQSTFFGPVLYDETGHMVGAQARSEYFKGLATGLSFFKSVSVRRHDDEIFRIGDPISLWTATGDNLVVWKDGRQVTRPWRWTMVLEKTSDNKWMIIHEHTSFGDPSVTPSQ